ncbi:MAG: nuclear transport factor 2 family protein [Bacteroidia bacterium]|nr:nuclear transport factor 2 family protein [Bacteroidia bacterium]
MMNKIIEHWHRYIQTLDPKILDVLLDDEVVFYSPVVYSPQKGKFLTTLYLLAASKVLSNNFKYVKEIVGENQCMLEFECEIDGKYVNGVDIITINNHNKITEFKVMVRPLKGVNAIHKEMARMLGEMKPK